MSSCTRAVTVGRAVRLRAAVLGWFALLTALAALATLPAAAQQGAGGATGEGSSAPAQAPPAPAAKKQGPAAAEPGKQGDLKSKGSYSIGLLMGAQLHAFGVGREAISIEKLSQGIRDAIGGAKPGMEDQQNFQALVRQSRESVASANKAAARKFLAENAKAQGVKTTPSGLQYKVITPGSGNSPQPTDEVQVNYRGTLIDGSEFDSSYKRGRPATFVLNQVIKGWQEGLVLMKPGAKWQLFVPPELAYGDNSPPGGPPPGSLLKFEVELLSVKPPTAPPVAHPAVPGLAPAPAPPATKGP